MTAIDATSPRAASKSAWAIEAVVELPSVKREIFAELDAHLPARAGIATNSSNIVVSRLADATARPQLCCNMHFFHPVLVMDLCEVVRGPETSDETCARAVAWSQRMGRTAIVVEKEIDGFIVNRILGAASREAFSLLKGGVASAEDIDIAVRKGLNWPMGPFQLADFSGLDTVLDHPPRPHGTRPRPGGRRDGGDPRAHGRRRPARPQERPRLLRLRGRPAGAPPAAGLSQRDPRRSAADLLRDRDHQGGDADADQRQRHEPSRRGRRGVAGVDEGEHGRGRPTRAISRMVTSPGHGRGVGCGCAGGAPGECTGRG